MLEKVFFVVLVFFFSTKIFVIFRYYSGEKTAPVLTVFIGGNHEASNYLQELPYGGWVAPKIYYLGKNDTTDDLIICILIYL